MDGFLYLICFNIKVWAFPISFFFLVLLFALAIDVTKRDALSRATVKMFSFCLADVIMNFSWFRFYYWSERSAVFQQSNMGRPLYGIFLLLSLISLKLSNVTILPEGFVIEFLNFACAPNSQKYQDSYQKKIFEMQQIYLPLFVLVMCYCTILGCCYRMFLPALTAFSPLSIFFPWVVLGSKHFVLIFGFSFKISFCSFGVV